MDPWKASVVALASLIVLLSFLLWRSGNRKDNCPVCPDTKKDCPVCPDTRGSTDDTNAMKDALISLRDRSKKIEEGISIMGSASIGGVSGRSFR